MLFCQNVFFFNAISHDVRQSDIKRYCLQTIVMIAMFALSIEFLIASLLGGWGCINARER